MARNVDRFSGQYLLVEATAHAQVEKRQWLVALGESLPQRRRHGQAGVDVSRCAAAGECEPQALSSFRRRFARFDGCAEFL